jgi:divalent metal cation (Fe/Co/Zn/Cd) transporter
MFLEGGVSLGAGIRAHSVALTAFGIDSGIELITAVVLLWRLRIELERGLLARVVAAERRAAWMVGVALLALCLYVVVDAGYGLWSRGVAENSALGVAIAGGAVLVMPWLARRKSALARELDSAALRGDAACSATCAYMAVALLIGLGAKWLTGAWWLDSVLALTLLVWLFPEALETLRGARAGIGGCACGDHKPVRSTIAVPPPESVQGSRDPASERRRPGRWTFRTYRPGN